MKVRTKPLVDVHVTERPEASERLVWAGATSPSMFMWCGRPNSYESEDDEVEVIVQIRIPEAPAVTRRAELVKSDVGFLNTEEILCRLNKRPSPWPLR
jgi:hypothetical protein